MAEMLKCVYDFLKDWQTLLGALIALAAAIVTITIMRRQAADEDQRHKNQLRRRAMSAQAQMPDALSAICAYVTAAGEYLTGQSDNAPDAPTVAVATLKEVIEYIDDSAAQRTFDLVSWYQIQRVRMKDQRFRPRNEPERSERLYDLVLLQAYANSLFDFQ